MRATLMKEKERRPDSSRHRENERREAWEHDGSSEGFAVREAKKWGSS